MLEENDLISLFVQIINRMNDKASSNNKSMDELNQKCIDQNEYINTQDKQIASLTQDVKSKEESLSEKEKEITELKEQLSGAETLIKDKLNPRIDKLEQEVKSLKESISKAEDNLKLKDVELIKLYVTVITKLLPGSEKDDAWNSYINSICSKGRDFIKNATTLENVSQSLILPDTWLTKVSSLVWWYKQSSIKEIVGMRLPMISVMAELLNDFEKLLCDFNIYIYQPKGDLSPKIDN